MCDTLVALPSAAARGRTLFGKNSDRERNEAQGLERLPARRYGRGETVALTYVSVPQVRETRACLISRPYWMWGAEMGANAAGVVIGNEALHARAPRPVRPALTGMDLVRLGLERAGSAAEAVEVMTGLLEAHGQGGDCGHYARFYYQNGFIIADAGSAFVLETVGRDWAVEHVTDRRSLSNAYSISTPDRVSRDLETRIDAEGWRRAGAAEFDLAERLIDTSRDAVSRGRERCARAGGLLARNPRLGLADITAILRDHGPDADLDPGWTPDHARGRSICMHAGPGDRRSQSVASWVSEIGQAGAVHWVTGSAAPCLSVFRPLVGDMAPPADCAGLTDRFDPATRWWRHEALHRAALGRFSGALARISPERDALEAAFRERMDEAGRNGTAEVMTAAAAACWRDADRLEREWTDAIGAMAAVRGAPGFQRSWGRLNRLAGMPKL